MNNISSRYVSVLLVVFSFLLLSCSPSLKEVDLPPHQICQIDISPLYSCYLPEIPDNLSEAVPLIWNSLEICVEASEIVKRSVLEFYSSNAK